MVTKVGMQAKFSDSMCDLLELEYDALEAYKLALTKIHDEKYKDKIKKFSEDNARHIEEITDILEFHHVETPKGPDLKQWLTKGKVAISSMIGDQTILAALHSNQEDISSAYERIIKRDDVWDDAHDILKYARSDEKRHNTWLKKTIHSYTNVS